MEKIITDLCNSLESSSNINTQEILMRVAFIFENFNGLPDEAWPDDIKYITVMKEDAFYLKGKLKEFIKSKPEDVLFGTSVWAFGKIAEKSDKNFLDILLMEGIYGDSESLYQIICALGNIGVKLFDGGGSSMFEVEENIDAAKKYLNI